MIHVLMIAYTTYSLDARVKRHSEALAERGDVVDVICLAGKEDHALKGVNLIRIPIARYRGKRRANYLSSYLKFFTAASWIAAKSSAKLPYDVVIVCSIPDLAVVSALIPKLFGSKVVLDIHDTMPELYRDKFSGKLGAVGAYILSIEERVSAWLADRVLAVHEPHARRLEHSGIPSSKITVVLNAPDPRLFQPVARQPDLGNPFTIVTHGTINQRLGLDTALEALNILRDRLSNPHLKLRILGPGEHLEAVRAHAEQLKLAELVSFEEAVPLERLSSVLLEASVGLVPNEATSATQLMLPVKMLEYASLQIPMIVSRLTTIQYYFPEQTLRYFEPGNAISLADAIEDLYLRPEQLPVLAQRAGEVMNRLSWRTQRKYYLEAIDSLLTEDTGVPAFPSKPCNTD
jgi:glycosyltransferase involved in cell wall biosynthesis